MVEIYHSLGQHITIHSILTEGLKSRKELVEEGKLEPVSQMYGPEHMNQIYFRWWNSTFARTRDTPWISIDVDPQKTKVFNAEYRYDADKNLYLASEILLSELIEKKERGEAMKGTIPLKGVTYHPLTAEPMLVDIDDERISDRHWFYSNEITIPRDVIPPTEFKDYHRGKI